MESEGIIEIESDLEVEDYRRALFWINKPIFLFITFIFVFAISGTGFIAFRENDVIALILFALSIVFFILYIFSTLLSIKRQSKNLAENYEITAIKFDEAGMESKTATTFIQMAWERFEKIRESNTDFLLYPQKNIFYPIPKRFFKSENQIKVFKQLLIDKLGAKAKLRD